MRSLDWVVVAVTLTAIVVLPTTVSKNQPTIAPTGMVDFYDGSNKLGTAPLSSKGICSGY